MSPPQYLAVDNSLRETIGSIHLFFILKLMANLSICDLSKYVGLVTPMSRDAHSMLRTSKEVEQESDRLPELRARILSSVSHNDVTDAAGLRLGTPRLVCHLAVTLSVREHAASSILTREHRSSYCFAQTARSRPAPSKSNE